VSFRGWPRLPAQPLMEAIVGQPLDSDFGSSGPFKVLELNTGIALRSWHRWIAEGGIPVLSVDNLCCHHLHVHPSAVYGAAWYEAWTRADEAIATAG
jgi:hypothetical protein